MAARRILLAVPAIIHLAHQSLPSAASIASIVAVCKTCPTMADAARRLFAVSLAAKKSSNYTDRLSKYLAKFGLKFKNL